jgi:hypothetical protein
MRQNPFPTPTTPSRGSGISAWPPSRAGLLLRPTDATPAETTGHENAPDIRVSGTSTPRLSATKPAHYTVPLAALNQPVTTARPGSPPDDGPHRHAPQQGHQTHRDLRRRASTEEPSALTPLAKAADSGTGNELTPPNPNVPLTVISRPRALSRGPPNHTRWPHVGHSWCLGVEPSHWGTLSMGKGVTGACNKHVAWLP